MNWTKKLLCTGLGLALSTAAALGQATHVTISQVYGAGGNSGAVVNADFVELFNPTASAVNLAGWSVQYMSATGAFSGTSGKVTITAGTIAPSSYFLVKVGAAGVNGGPLTPDFDGTTINMSGTTGKVALCNDAVSLAGTCPTSANIVDFVGFGTTPNCFEGAGPTPAPSTANAVFRVSGGCVDTNVNSLDFVAAPVAPRNSSSPTNTCVAGTPPSGSGTVVPNNPCPGTSVTFTVTTTPGTLPADPITSVSADFSAIALGVQPFTQGPTNTWTYTTVIVGIEAAYTFPVTITDMGGRTGSTSLGMTITSCNPRITSGTGASPSGVCNGSNTLLTVNMIAGQNPSSLSFTVTADLTGIGGPAVATFTQVGATFGYTYNATVGGATTAGPHILPFTTTDDQGRIVPGTITVVTAPCVDSTSTVVISQVYGGGGNTGSTFTHDFIELFNRSGAPVDLTGWSVQYASQTDTNGGFASGNPVSNTPVLLSGIIQPGRYLLIQMSQGAGGTTALPTPDFIGTVLVSSTNARIALVDNSTPLLLDCASTSIRDLVGYGEGTSIPLCFEGDTGVGPTQTLDNTSAANRLLNGCQDTNRNRIDFERIAPNPRNSASPANPCVVIPTGVCCRGSTCTTTITSAGACAAGLIGSPTAGAFFVASASTCNASATVNTPCCYADYNKVGGVTVQDIFDFLGDWFAGFPYANTGGTGVAGPLTVQNIFDFLTDWFAGGC